MVPVDLRMTTAVIERIAGITEAGVSPSTKAMTRPTPSKAGLTGLQVLQLSELTADADPDWPDDWEAQIAGWQRPIATRSSRSTSRPAPPPIPRACC